MEKEYLHRRFVAKLGATDGTGSYKTAKEVFKGGLDPCFKKWGIIFSGVAPEMDISGDSLIEDGKFSEFLGNTFELLERRRILGAQFVKFYQNYPYPKGMTIFTVITKDDKPVVADLSNVFVAGTRSDVRNELYHSYVYHLDDEFIWPKNHQCTILYPLSISA